MCGGTFKLLCATSILHAGNKIKLLRNINSTPETSIQSKQKKKNPRRTRRSKVKYRLNQPRKTKSSRILNRLYFSESHHTTSIWRFFFPLQQVGLGGIFFLSLHNRRFSGSWPLFLELLLPFRKKKTLTLARSPLLGVLSFLILLDSHKKCSGNTRNEVYKDRGSIDAT